MTRFARVGEGGRALMVSLLGATVGQVCGVLAFTFLIGPVAAFSVNFLFPEFFALELLGLTAAAAVLIGLLLAMVGPDPVTGYGRLTFGIEELEGGIEVVPALIGLLALRVVLLMAAGGGAARRGEERERVRFPRLHAGDLRVLVGAGVDRFGAHPFRLSGWLLAGAAAGYLLLATASGGALFAGAALAFGAGWAWQGLLHLGAVRFWPQAPGYATGVVRTGIAAGAGTGPLVSGLLIGAAGYAAVWLLMAVLTTAAGLLLVAAARAGAIDNEEEPT